jgi:hypothetical protein
VSDERFHRDDAAEWNDAIDRFHFGCEAMNGFPFEDAAMVRSRQHSWWSVLGCRIVKVWAERNDIFKNCGGRMRFTG